MTPKRFNSQALVHHFMRRVIEPTLYVRVIKKRMIFPPTHRHLGLSSLCRRLPSLAFFGSRRLQPAQQGVKKPARPPIYCGPTENLWWGRLGDNSRFEPTKSTRTITTPKVRKTSADSPALTSVQTRTQRSLTIKVSWRSSLVPTRPLPHRSNMSWTFVPCCVRLHILT